MKKSILFILLIAGLQIQIFAQSDSSFTLQQCIDYALKNNVSIKNAELDIKINRARKTEYMSIGLPQINGSVAVLDNQFNNKSTLQRMFISNTPGLFFNPTIPEGQVINMPNLFQTKSNGDMNLSASQLIFSGSYFVGLNAAKSLIELSQKSYEMSELETIENVTKAYYLLLINQERIKILNNNISRLDTLLIQSRALNEKGFIEKIDVDRLEVTLNNLKTENEKFINLIDLTKYALKLQMGYDINKDIQLKSDINELNSVEAFNVNEGSFDIKKRKEYQLLQIQRQLENYNKSNLTMGYLPTIAAFAKYGFNSGENNIGDLITKGFWGDYFNWGISIQVPIFDSFGKAAKVKQSKLAIVKIENNIDNLNNALSMQVKSSEITVKNAVKSLDIQKKNLELAKEISRVSKIKYQSGIGSNLEVINAESSLKEAQTNYYNALYDLMVAKIDYQKATGTLKQ